MTSWTLIPTVLDVQPDHATQRTIAAGGFGAIQDPRLMLLGERDRIPAVERLIRSGADMTGAVWLDPTI